VARNRARRLLRYTAADHVAHARTPEVVEEQAWHAGPSIQREDGSTEHADEDVQNLSALVPGRELRSAMLEYSKRVEDFKEQFPDFEKYVGQDIPIPLSVRDEILRQPNGPDIAQFLGFAPDVIENLNRMHALDAAKCIEAIGEDLERASLPGGETDQASWKAARNLQLRQGGSALGASVRKASKARGKR